MPGDDLAYRRQVVLNNNGSVRWKFVLMGTWEPPTLHETDVRCVQGAWPYIVVSDDGSLRRWERQLGYGWYLADATRPKEPVQPFDVNERPRRWTGCLLYTSPSPRDLSTSRMPSSA